MTGKAAQLQKKFVMRTLSKLYGEKGAQLSLRYSRLREKVRYAWGIPALRAKTAWRLRKFPKVQIAPAVKSGDRTDVERYWGTHTVWGAPILSEEQSRQQLADLNENRPYKNEYCELLVKRPGKTMLDYGCGTGNHLLGFALNSDADKVIGVDISARALMLARSRLALHDVDPSRQQLIMISDSDPHIPVDDGSVDFVSSLGVIHHVSHPIETLKEIRRLMAPGAYGRIMVYNELGLWVNLQFGYALTVLRDDFPGKTAKEAFESYADLGAPIAKCYKPEEFCNICREAGFEADYVGGYYMPGENNLWARYGEKALNDERVPAERREFLKELEINDEGYVTHLGKPAGHGAVYHIVNPG